MASPKVSQALLFAGINPTGFTGHSFRRGAANSALEAGIPKTDIMKTGSNSIDRYFSVTGNNTLLFFLSKQLYTNPLPSSFAPNSRHARFASTHDCYTKFDDGFPFGERTRLATQLPDSRL